MLLNCDPRCTLLIHTRLQILIEYHCCLISYTLTPNNFFTAQLWPLAQIGPPLHNGRTSSRPRLLSTTGASHSPCWKRSTSCLLTVCVRASAAMVQKPITCPWLIVCSRTPFLGSEVSSNRRRSEHVYSNLPGGRDAEGSWVRCADCGILSTTIGDQMFGKGAYSSLKEMLRTTAMGKSRPSETAARRAERNVNFGGAVGVEKKSRCLWKAVYLVPDMADRLGKNSCVA